jgi:hypothetical protein
MIFLKNGYGFKPKPNVCVRDTKVRKFSGFDVRVEKKRSFKRILSTLSFLKAFILMIYKTPKAYFTHVPFADYGA